MENEIHQIYDRIFKRIFNLSNLAIINMINGLFQTNYPTDSTVDYPNKEFVNRLLKGQLADVFITINKVHTYHLEAQVKKDNNIVLRVFEYGFQYALENMDEEDVLRFPEPIIIYLSKENDIPKESTLKVDFGNGRTYKYKVKNYIYLDHDVVEINQKKMVILIPFQLLHLKEIIHKNPTRENFQQLQALLQNDILTSIEANLKVGNITLEDANQLVELTHQLYEHLYHHYYEIGGCEDMKELLPGALELPNDKYRIRIDELEKELSKKDEEKAKIEEEKAKIEEEKAKAEEQKAKAESEKNEAWQEVERLRQQIKELQK